MRIQVHDLTPTPNRLEVPSTLGAILYEGHAVDALALGFGQLQQRVEHEVVAHGVFAHGLLRFCEHNGTAGAVFQVQKILGS